MTLSKTQLHRIGQSGWFLVSPLGPLLKNGLPLMKNVLKPSDKSVLKPLGLTAIASVTYAAIQNKTFESEIATLITSNEGLNDSTKKIKSLENAGLFINGVSEVNKNKAKEQKGGSR